MGLLDTLIGAASGAAGNNANPVHAAIAQHVLGFLSNPQSGGLNGLLGTLKAGALESAVQSWISKGPNQAVGGTQLQAALGNQHIQELAAKLGIPADQAASHLAQVLPEIVNHLTPNGSVPAPSLVGEGINLLKSRLGI
jgi:uncharacterized protein YidB (DUF937 family)